MGSKHEGNQHQPQPPQLNKFMHSRNPYRNCVSFKQLAITYPEFRVHCTYDISGKVYLDFKNTQALKALTTVLLDKDFGLKVNIPDNRLIPTLPLRMNYLLWIEDLLSLVYPKASSSKESIIGFDIGTGAACVYPLLGSKKFGWGFVATENDELNFESAQQNVAKNDLGNSILLKKSSDLFDVLKEEDVMKFIGKIKSKENSEPTDENLSSEVSSDESKAPQLSSHQNGLSHRYLIDFTMCNPPFFSSEVEMDTNHNSRKETRSQPTSVSTGSSQERVTEGGEVAFITRIIEMSIQYKKEIRIFSTLVGKKNDVKSVVRLVKEKAESSFVCVSKTEFCQGRTMRWGVAWTFDSGVSLEKVLSKKERLSQKPLVLHIPRSLMTSYTVQTVWIKIVSWLKDIKIKPHIIKNKKYYVGAVIRAYKSTWLHQRQKRRKKNRQLMDSSNSRNTVNSNDEANSSQKRENEDNEEENPPKKPKIKVSDASSKDENQDANTFLRKVEDTVSSEDFVSAEVSNPVCEKTTKSSGSECILKCFLHLKQIEALISLEMNYLSGSGKKEAANQLLQYMKNRLTKQGE